MATRAWWSAAIALLSLGACGDSGPGETSETTSSCRPGSLGCPCDAGACDEGLVCAQAQCIDPVGTTSSTTTGTDTSGTTSSTTSAETTDTPGGCAPADDSLNALCEAADPARPYCSREGECVDCTGLVSCENVSPETPVCGAAGMCVECTPEVPDACADTTPVCDASLEQCVGCTAHADCQGSACKFDSGACFPTDSVVWVDIGDPACSPQGGDKDQPYCTIGQAVSGLSGEPTTIFVYGGSYDGGFSIGAPHEVAILGLEGSGVVSVGGQAGTGLTLEPGAWVAVSDLMFSGSSDGIACSLSALMLDDVIIRDEENAGVASSSCTVVVRSSVLADNASRGLTVTGGTVELVNTFVSDNSIPDVAGGAGIVASSGADVSLLYTTMIGNDGTIGGPGSIICSGDPKPTIDVRNSVVFGKSADSIQLSACELTAASFAYDYEFDVPDVTNGKLTQLDDGNVGLYIVMQGPDASAGIYRAEPGMGNVLSTLGEWMTGDPKVDFEGDPRPSDHLSSDYVGADVP